MSEDRDKDIPAFGLEVQDTRLRQKLEAMREAIQKLMGTRGVGGGRAAVRWDDLKQGGFVTETGRLIPPGNSTTTVVVGGGGGGGTDPDEPDLTKPPTPTGLAATAGLGNVLVEWGAPIYTAGRGHKQTNVYATKQPAADNTAYTINDAVRVDSAVGPLTVIALPSDLGVKWRIWIRFESNDGVESDPAGGVNGVVATTGLIGNADLGDLIVEAGNLAAGAVTAAKFGAGIEPVTIITAASLPTTKSTNAIYWSGKLYRWNGTAYVATVPTTDLSGQVADAQIAGLAASKVTGQLSDSQIAAVAAAKLTGQIVGTQITDGAISTAKLSAGSVTTAVLAADAVTADKIAANAVTASEIAAGAVTTAKLAAGAVTANEIAAGAIITGKLAAGAVTASELAADAVTAGKIQAGAITANKLAANAIAVGTAAVENGAINNAMIATAAIDDAKIANLSAAKLTAGDGTIGGNLRSSNYVAGSLGWMVRPDGFAEFSNVVVRGTVFATAGEIGGALIQSDHIRSTNWESLVAGWRLNNNGSGQIGGIQILSDRIQSGNFESGDTGFMLRADGLFELNAPNGWVRSQMIEDKAVTSMKIDDAAVGTLQIAGNAVILPMFSQFGFGTNVFYPTPNGVSIEMRWDDGQLLTPAEMNAISSIPWREYRPYTSNPQLVSTSGSVYRMLLCSTPEFETFGQKVSIGYSVDIGHSESSPTSWYAADIVRCAEGVSPLAQRFEKVIVTFPRGGPDNQYIDEYTGEYFPNVIVSYAPLNKEPMTNGYRTATPQTIMVQDTPPEGKYSYHLLLRSATGASLTYQSIQTAGIYGTSFAGNTWLDVKGIRR